MKKNDIYKGKVVDNGMEFEGIVKENNIPVFIPNAIKDEEIEYKVLKVNKSYAFGKVEKILKESKYRIKPICPAYHKCGGCSGMHIDYLKTLEMKKETVTNTLKKQGISKELIEKIYGMKTPFYYRNKVQYPVRNINGKTVMGMFSKRTHSIVDIDKCYIADKTIDEVANTLFNLLIEKSFVGLNEEDYTGDIRNIMVRRGIHTDEVMCVIVANRDIQQELKKTDIIEKLTKKYSNIQSIVINVNTKKDNVILSNENLCIYGKEYITDKIGEYTFKISVNSFFQVNTIQVETLYTCLKDKLMLEKDNKVLELYSGVGTIGIFLSKEVKEILGVEIVEEAVKAAKENVDINKIENVKYICDDATKAIEKLNEENYKVDIVVVDPPRKGLDSKGIEILKNIKAKKIGYVSCNPATLARDLNLLSDLYEVKSINLVDMFPWTHHVECCSVLKLKESTEI